MARILLLLLAVFVTPLSAANYHQGQHYQKLVPNQPNGGDKIEIIEFFWYGCPHCYHFEPDLNKWKKTKPANVKVKLVPAIFRPSWEVHAKAYYAAEELGVLDKAHLAIFEAIHKHKKPTNTAEEIGDIVAAAGVDKKTFIETMNSFSVDSNVRNAKQLLRDFKVRGVPAIGVNGLYLTSASMTGGNQNVISVMDYLIEQESKRLNIKIK